LHTIWTLPQNDGDFSRRWGLIKSTFSAARRGAGSREEEVSDSRRKNRRAGIWQRRFWEHLLRDEADFAHHLDYIHYNPVKHGYASCPHDWPYSSFQRWAARGAYEQTWCCACDGRDPAPPQLGEAEQQGTECPFGE
jgi:putative transposase